MFLNLLLKVSINRMEVAKCIIFDMLEVIREWSGNV